MNSPGTAGKQIRPPQFLHTVTPQYTPRAKVARLTGNVLIGCRIDINGVPHDCAVLKPLGMGLDEEALKAARAYRFAAAVDLITGQPVEFQVTINVPFRLP
jgi:TonB family protein